MSGTFPTTPRPASLSLQSVTQTFVNMTQSGRRNVRTAGPHRWNITVSYSNLTRAQFAPIFAFIMDQDGEFEVFDFVPPDISTPRGTAGGTPNVNGGSQNGKSVLTQGWTPNQPLAMAAGDIFTFTDHTKVYMVTQDFSTDGAGAGTLNFAPALLESPSNLEILKVTDVPFRMMQSANIREYAARNPLLYNFEMKMTEVV